MDCSKNGVLLPSLSFVQKKLEKTSLNYWINEINSESKESKASAWISEVYLLSTMFVGIFALYIVNPVNSFGWMWLLTVFLPIYLIAEFCVLLLGWIFVHETRLHSIRRSLLCFLLNIPQLSLYFGILEISIGSGLPTEGKTNLFYAGVLDIVSMTSPSNGLNIQGAIETGRFFISLLLILVIVGSIVGGILRKEAK